MVEISDLNNDWNKKALAAADAEHDGKCLTCEELRAALTTERQARAHVEQELNTLRDAIARYRHTPEDAELWQTPEAFVNRVLDLRELPEALLASERAREELQADRNHAVERQAHWEVRAASLQMELTAATRTGAQLREEIEELKAEALARGPGPGDL